MDYQAAYKRLIEQGSKTKIDGAERHHILPTHAGGGDEEENLIFLLYRQHILAHLLLWKIHGRVGDYAAYNLMRGIPTLEKKQLICRLGGSVTGKRNAESNFINQIKTPESLKLGGIRGAEAGRDTNCFFNTEKHAIAAAMGGAAQGKINAANGHLKTITKLSKRNTGQIWITNGVDCRMQHPGLPIPEGWKKGRICPRRSRN